ncbi:phage shock protein e-related protein [Anaeramoeba ignava]|uniref:Phage shock protein e-related protein n=1 Tax=Anaeramoeba ignava TaxID=1746090 RepID=A0A9Q0L9I7_ANAIG|nr:phage shock protein e-related protein [Anaeramoeba ignava]
MLSSQILKPKRFDFSHLTRLFAQQAPKIVVVGGVAGGATAAAKARRINESAKITVFEKGPYPSFGNCGLPYYISNTIPTRGDLLLRTPAEFWDQFRVDMKVNHEVTKIDLNSKKVYVKDLDNKKEFSEEFDKLILSPGAKAIIPRNPTFRAKNLFPLKTIPDSELIKRYLQESETKNVVIVGASYIGMEVAENFHKLGMNVTVIDLLPNVFGLTMDIDISRKTQTLCEIKGIKFILNDGISHFETDARNRATEAVLQSGKKIPLDLGILSLGVFPDTAFLKDSGITLDDRGYIPIDDRCSTNHPDVYAAGDAVLSKSILTNTLDRFALAGPANKQGRVAGANAAGGNMRFRGSLGTAIISLFGYGIGRTGLTINQCKKLGIKYTVAETHLPYHVSYYPGFSIVSFVLIAEEKTGRILGAQAMGKEGVDKKIDTISTAISANMTVFDLEDLDLCYSPQFGKAKECVNQIGMVAANHIRGESTNITLDDFKEKMKKNKENIQVIDVRTPEEYQISHLPDALLVDFENKFRENMHKIDKNKEVIVHCLAGQRGYFALRVLRQHGFNNVKNITGGMRSMAKGCCGRGEFEEHSIIPFTRVEDDF